MTTEKTIVLNSPIKKYRFIFLLGALIFLMLAIPIVQYLNTMGGQGIAPIAFFAVYILVILGGASTASTHPRQFRIACLLASFVFLGQIFVLWFKKPAVLMVEQACSALFLIYILYLLMVFLFSARKVNQNVICASLCGYLLLAVLWANLFSLAELIEPGSFAFAYKDVPGASLQSIGMNSSNSILAIYYSLVTLTTLGYGDIAPLSPATRMLAAMEAVIGQVYLTVLIARLVGIHIATTSNQMEKNESP